MSLSLYPGFRYCRIPPDHTRSEVIRKDIARKEKTAHGNFMESSLQSPNAVGRDLSFAQMGKRSGAIKSEARTMNDMLETRT